MKVRTHPVAVSIAVAAAAAVVAVPTGADAAQSSSTTFVVNTQFWAAPSQIVSATGPLAGCTTVQELDGSQTIQTGRNSLLFVGTKRLDCGAGTVTIAYEATINTAAGRKTFGTWMVTDSTLEGVAYGGGRLTGDAARCTTEAGADGCILDTFTGDVGG